MISLLNNNFKISLQYNTFYDSSLLQLLLKKKKDLQQYFRIILINCYGWFFFNLIFRSMESRFSWYIHWKCNYFFSNYYCLLNFLRALIISRVFKFLENLAKETETEADDILLETLEKPIGNVPLALGLYLIIELLPLSGIADVFLTNTVKALIAYTIFSVLTKAIGPIFELLAIKSWVTAALSMWLERFTRVLIWILAIAIILDIFGVEIGPIIAGLGTFLCSCRSRSTRFI